MHDEEYNEDFYSEIDIVESVSLLTKNEITLDTNPNACTMIAPPGTVEVHKTDCDYDTGGCDVLAPHGTFGETFNKKGGGVWATQVEADGIRVWYFARSDIPADIKSDKPDPSKWSIPVLNFVPQNCDIKNSWKKMKIVSPTYNVHCTRLT